MILAPYVPQCYAVSASLGSVPKDELGRQHESFKGKRGKDGESETEQGKNECMNEYMDG